jgi:hypothetical protein
MRTSAPTGTGSRENGIILSGILGLYLERRFFHFLKVNLFGASAILCAEMLL